MPGAEDVASPVSTGSIVLETIRSALLLCCLAGVTALFLFVHAWIVAAVLVAIMVGAARAGAFTHPAQLRVARRPPSTHDALATPLARRRQAWLRLDDGTGQVLVAEVRSARVARMLSPGPLPLTVVGPFEAHAWVVLQAGRLTMWPVRRLSATVPEGARPIVAKADREPAAPPRRPFWR